MDSYKLKFQFTGLFDRRRPAIDVIFGRMSGGGSVQDVNSKEELDEMLIRDQRSSILFFWSPSSVASEQMNRVFFQLSAAFPYADFFRIDAKEKLEISEAFSVSSVPCFLFFKGSNVVDKLEGADPASLANKVAKLAGSVNEAESAAPASLGLAAGPAIIEAVKELSKENVAPFSENCPSVFSESLTKLN
ncbi:thioredoxin superfamily protein [Wolffia australiana]